MSFSFVLLKLVILLVHLSVLVFLLCGDSPLKSKERFVCMVMLQYIKLLCLKTVLSLTVVLNFIQYDYVDVHVRVGMFCAHSSDIICIGNSMICSDIWHKYHE